MVAALKKAESTSTLNTRTKAIISWDKAFHDPKVFEWLFAQKKN